MNNYFELFIESFLAVLGIIIAIVQLNIDKRQKREEEKMREKSEEEKNIIIDLLNQSEGVMGAINAFAEEINLINEKANVEGAGLVMLQSMMNSGPIMINEYDKVRKNLLAVYKKILQNEERFSLSYGFNRYIDAFRNFCLNDVEVNQMRFAFAILVDFVKHNQNKDSFDSKKLIELMNNFQKESFDCMKQLQDIDLYIKELKLKYEKN